MGLNLKYGTFLFPTETTLVPISKNNIFDGRDIRSRQRQVWQVRTILQAATQSAITTAVAALEAELDDGKTLQLFENDGTTPTGQAITNCKVRGQGFPESTGSEYANKRVVTINFESTADVAGGEQEINFQESISYFGGGPISILQGTIRGKPRKFQTAEFSIFRAIQSGSATGRLAFPDPPGPAFPGHGDENDEPDTERFISHDTNGEERFNLRWTYRFASAEPLNTNPNPWL